MHNAKKQKSGRSKGFSAITIDAQWVLCYNKPNMND